MVVQSDLRFTFTAATGVFEVVEFHLSEGLSETFRLEVDLSSTDPAVEFGKILDRPALFTIWQGDQPVRYVHGSVSTFQQGETGFRRTRYRAVVEPRLARLRLCSDWRIFQILSVPDIAKVMLKKHALHLDYELRAAKDRYVREYCVQAGETDYHFVERIMREECFFYGFVHSEEGCRLVHCDFPLIFGKQAGPPVEYNPKPGADRPGPALHRFTYSENVRSAQQVQRDYSFKNPKFTEESKYRATDLEHQADSYERYDYPGRYRGDKTGKAFSRSRLLGLRGDACQVIAEGDDARLVPGLYFDLIGHPRDDMNCGWRPVHLEHHGKQYVSQAEESAGADRGTHYNCIATLVRDNAEWRPEPLPKPRIDGPQMATVVGPPGEEIYCDEYGRVKVHFPWDRQTKENEPSSCWIQVSQNIAGALWGHMAIPRIGQGVIVSYQNSDPDQPIITGRCYTALQRPPYELPANKTRMTIKSQTHKGDGFNELRFEDEAGLEEVFIHAQRDQNNVVKNDETTHVGHDRSEQVDNDETLTVGHNRSDTVGNDEQVLIGQHRRHEIGEHDDLIIGGNHSITTAGDRTEQVGNNRDDRTVANHRVEIGGNLLQQVQQDVLLQAGQRITQHTKVFEIHSSEAVVLKGAGGTLRIDAAGITLDGIALTLNGPMRKSTGGAGNSLTLTGSTVNEEGGKCMETK
ncbi:MAG: type VI secretion system tip protein VgrG [Paucimonas sp.]|jgi:type VI secretion system secreted protein VgrG|nr:type VI secretion system tip protein VgrG [Paucimonas sp.]